MDHIYQTLTANGPLVGQELVKAVSMDDFSLWKACMLSNRIVMRICGNRYLRFDKYVKGYARLSPSIKREFYGYTIIGTHKQLPEIERKAKALEAEINQISQKKYNIAYEVMERVVKKQKHELIEAHSCFIIAGDVVYRMAHADLRPESSTGTLVRGSDLDIVVITENLDAKVSAALDQAIYEEKYYLLKNPIYQEEIDFIVKDIGKVANQLCFDSFKHMIASKILDEGLYLLGNNELFIKVKAMLEDYQIPAKLAVLKQQAIKERANAEKVLLTEGQSLAKEESMKLFCTIEEREEFI